MTKMQKVWMWVFIAMFAVPEILFLTTPLSILSFTNNFSAMNINPPIYYLVNSQFFTDQPIYLLLVIAIEWVGVLGLLLIGVKSKKRIPTILLGIVLLWLSVDLYFAYIISTMGPII